MARARARIDYGFVCAVGLAILAMVHARALDYRGDDAFITLRYVRNLISGQGLVYNPGERVEGYSNLLWLLLLASGARLTSDLVALARGASMLLAGASAFMTYAVARRLELTRLRSLLAPLLLAAATPFATWAGSGLESPLFSCLILAALHTRLRDRPNFVGMGAWLGLAAITRPEGVVFALVATVYELTGSLPGRRALANTGSARPGGIGAASRLLGASAALWLPQLAFRRSYYGQWLPNTYFAKVDWGGGALERGASYLTYYCNLASFLPLSCALAAVVCQWKDPRARYVALLLGGYLAWVVAVGGDGLVMFRFVAHVLPLICLLVAHGVYLSADALGRAAQGSLVAARWLVRASPGYSASLTLLLVLGLSWPSLLMLLRPQWPWRHDVNGLFFPDPGRRWIYFDQYFSERVAQAGRFLDQHAGPSELIAANPAGIAFHTRQPVLDLLGLTDATIARSHTRNAGRGRAGHERSDPDYVLARKPAYVLLGNVAVLPFPLSEEQVHQQLYLPSEQSLWQRPEFHRDYSRVVVELAPSGPYRFFTFYRRWDADYRGP